MPFKRVVVTGLGALTPIGNTVQEYWNGLVSGVSGAGPITKFNAEKFRTRFACEVKGLDINQFIPRQEARKMDPFAQYALIVADEAIRDSGLDLKPLTASEVHEQWASGSVSSPIDLDRAGVVWGSGIGGLKTFEEEARAYATGDGSPRYNPFFIPKMIADSASGVLSIRYGFRGVNYVTVSACASATNAMVDAFNFIRLGRLDVVIAGGSEAAVTEAGVGGFNALRALSERNDSPETASRPFDKDRDGFVLGEGAGALILEEYEHAKARGAKIYGELIGGGMSSDAYHITAPHPKGLGAINVMKDALHDASISPEAVDYINVHGTSTPLGDISEATAIEHVFGQHAYKLGISSTKSMTGHLLGAAGAIEAIASLMAIKHNRIPPTINHFTDDDQFNPNLNFTFNQAQQRTVNVVMSNTFGFGGHNFSVIFRKLD